MVKKNKLKIVGIITARGGSKGVPGKNIKQLGKHPLLAYTISVAKKSKLLTDLIVSTDDKKIIKVAQKYGAHVPFVRPAILANDKTKHVPVLQHAVGFLENKLDYHFDYVVLLQPTSPFRVPADIDNTILITIKKKADSGVSIVEIEDTHPMKAKKIKNNIVYSFFDKKLEPEGMRRQDLPIAYKRSGAVYVVKRDVLMKQNRLYGKKIAGYIVPLDRSIDIDNELDFIKAEYMFKKLTKKGSRFFQ